MINLLPPQEKKELLRCEQRKIAVILAGLVLFSLVSFSLVLLGVRIYLGGQLTLQKSLVITAQDEFHQPEIQELQAKIASANQTISSLDSFYQNPFYFTKTLEVISKTLPQEVLLSSVSVLPQNKEIAKISISGFAPNREVLFELKKALENQPGFSGISFPPSGWIEAVNINFSVSFTGNISEL